MKKNPDPLFTPEQEVLLWAIRVDHTKDLKIAEILEKGVNWVYIRETAIQQGIIPLLYRRLTEEMATFIPAEEVRSLRELFLENGANNLRMTQELLRVLAILDDAGIEAMPFKGPALAMQAYGNLSMRSFCDLDILIHEKDFDRVYEIMNNHGFSLEHPVNSIAGRKLMVIQKTNFSVWFQGIRLEIHWKITERFLSVPFNMDQLWARSDQVFLNGRRIRTLSPEDMMIVSCVHGTKHVWQNLKWLADLVYLISNNSEIHWNKIFDLAGRMGLIRIVSLGDLLAQRYGGTKFCCYSEYRFISNIDMQNIANYCAKKFFFYIPNKWFFTPPLLYLNLRERFRDKLNFIIYTFTDRILSPNYLDFNVISLPNSLFPLYLLIRPFRVIKGFYPGKKLSPLKK